MILVSLRFEQFNAHGKEEMPKYGRGLNRELVSAINAGEIKEPFSTKDVRKLIALKKWDPSPRQAGQRESPIPDRLQVL